jgi:hypothetical protein
MDINEASQDTIRRLQLQKNRYTERLETLKRKQAECSEAANRIKEKEGKTKSAITQKIYAARAQEERLREELYMLRLQAVAQAAKVVDQRLTVVNLRLQSRSQKKLA